MNPLSVLTSRLPHLAPELTACLIGVVISLACLRRHSVPASLVLAGCGAQLVSLLCSPLIQVYVSGLHPGDESPDWWEIIGIGANVYYAGGTCLLLTAAFTGRRRPGSDDSGKQSNPGRRAAAKRACLWFLATLISPALILLVSSSDSLQIRRWGDFRGLVIIMVLPFVATAVTAAQLVVFLAWDFLSGPRKGWKRAFFLITSWTLLLPVVVAVAASVWIVGVSIFRPEN